MTWFNPKLCQTPSILLSQHGNSEGEKAGLAGNRSYVLAIPLDQDMKMQLGITQFIKLYAISVPVFFVIDLLWLGMIAKPFYHRHLGYVLREQVLWWAAIFFYLFFLLGLVVFVIAPSVESRSLFKAVLLGLFFGFITYQTYELTNYALIRDWPLIVVVVDIAWGMVLSSLVSAITYLIYTRFL
jgi:uncharacterized membrane protein